MMGNKLKLKKTSVSLFTAICLLLSLLCMQAANAANTAYYVDCSTAANGSGTMASPFNNLAAINALVLGAGDTVSFKRGVTCLGTFAPQGAGTAAAPIAIGAYGDGTSRPVINANGQLDGVLLKNMPYVQLRDLEVTAPGDNTKAMRGVHVLGQDGGDLPGVVLQNLYVHDVRGYMPATVAGGSATLGKFADASGGIVVEVLGSAVQTAFHDLQIVDNTVTSVDRQGIYLWSNWCKRSDLHKWGTDCTANFYPYTNLLIRGNVLTDIGGDGIAPMTTQGGLVESNTLSGFNVRAKTYNAGMWTANSDNVTFQYNNTSGGKTSLDGMAYDVDHATNGVIFQYNLSHNNEGGFFLMCPTGATNTKNFIIRYNISVNDRNRMFQTGCGGELVNGKIYNNTMYIGDGISPYVFTEGSSFKQDAMFYNNIVYKTGAGSASWGTADTNFKIDHNVLFNVPVPSWATNTVTTDPLFADPGSIQANGYVVGAGSSALGAGVLMADNGGRDDFGNPVSATAAPSIGAFESPLAYYKLDAASGTTAADASSYGHTGTLVGSPTWMTSGGKINGALQLNGSGDYVSLPNAFNPGSTDFSIAGWVKLNAAAGTNQIIFQQEGTAGRSILYRDTATGRLGTYLGNTALMSTAAIPLGQWTYVAVVKAGSTVSLYVNGNPDGSATRTVEAATGNFRLGAHKSPDASNVNWNGSLDDFVIYDAALSAAQVKERYAASAPEAYYKLDEATGTTAADASGNGLNGTLMNGPTWAASGGVVNGAIHLSGTGDYVSLPNAVNPGTTDFTLAAWAKLDSAAGANQIIFQQEGTSGRTWLYRDTATGRLNSFLGNVPLSSLSVIPVGEWTHVAVTKSGNILALYVNGQFEGSAYRSVESSGDSYRLGAHKSPGAGNVNWNGSFDGVRIYDTALDDAQIWALYSQDY